MTEISNWWSRIRAVRSDALHRVGKNAAIGLFGAAGTMVFMLLQTMLLAKTLPMEAFGFYLIILNFYTFIYLILGLRISNFVYRFCKEFEETSSEALSSFLCSVFWCCVIVGLICAAVFALAAPLIASGIYHQPELALAFAVYAPFLAGKPVEDFFTGVLRLHDRFAKVVIPQVTGRAWTLAGTAFYVFSVDSPSLVVLAAITMGGWLYSSLAPSFAVWRTLRTLDGFRFRGIDWPFLRENRARFGGTLFQTNLVGILKSASDVGGMFFLGIFGGPVQSALFGFAMQLTKPFTMLESNIQAAIVPEVTKQYHKREFGALRRLVFVAAGLAGVVGIMSLGGLMAFLNPIIVLIGKPEYLPVYWVVILLAASAFMRLSSGMFFPLALCMDRLGRRNLVVSARVLFLAIALTIEPTAFNVALAGLLGAVFVRIFNDIPLYRSLKELKTASRHTSTLAKAI